MTREHAHPPSFLATEHQAQKWLKGRGRNPPLRSGQPCPPADFSGTQSPHRLGREGGQRGDRKGGRANRTSSGSGLEPGAVRDHP